MTAVLCHSHNLVLQQSECCWKSSLPCVRDQGSGYVISCCNFSFLTWGEGFFGMGHLLVLGFNVRMKGHPSEQNLVCGTSCALQLWWDKGANSPISAAEMLLGLRSSKCNLSLLYLQQRILQEPCSKTP